MRQHMVSTALLVFTLFLGVSTPAIAQETEIPQDFIQSLEQFVGSWKGTYTQGDPSGYSATIPVKLTGKYILDSTAIQINLILLIMDNMSVEIQEMIVWDIEMNTIALIGAASPGLVYQCKGTWSSDEPPTLILKGEKQTKEGTKVLVNSYSSPAQNTLKIEYDTVNEKSVRTVATVNATRE